MYVPKHMVFGLHSLLYGLQQVNTTCPPSMGTQITVTYSVQCNVSVPYYIHQYTILHLPVYQISFISVPLLLISPSPSPPPLPLTLSCAIPIGGP